MVVTTSSRQEKLSSLLLLQRKCWLKSLKQRAHKLEKIKKDAEELAAKLEGVSLKIATKVSATGTIFGSVGNIQIADEHWLNWVTTSTVRLSLLRMQ